MTQSTVSVSRTLRNFGFFALLATLAYLPGCGGSTGGAGGEQGALFLTKVEWGRLVNIVDMNGNLVDADVIIRPDLTMGADYELSTNPVTEAETLKIVQYANGSTGFTTLFDTAQENLPSVSRKGPASPSPYTKIARNAAFKLTFSEALKLASVTQDTLQFWVGNPASTPQDGRYLAYNDDDAGIGVVIFSPLVSGRQSAELGLPQNAVGFPASLDSINDNLLLRLPTEINVFDGRPDVLQSAAGRFIKAQNGINADPITLNQDGSTNVVRSLRTGNDADLFSGFLIDNTRPNLVGLFDVTFSGITVLSGAERELVYALDEAVCDGINAKVGDVLEAGDGAVILVTSVVSGTAAPYTVRGNLLEGTLDSLPSDTSGQWTTRYSDAEAGLQACFLRVTPAPGLFPTGLVDKDSTITVRFSEAIDPASVLSMHSLVVTAFELTANAPERTAAFRQGGQFANESVANYIDRQQGFHLPVNSTGTLSSAEFGGRVLFGSIEVADGNREFTLKPAAGYVDPDTNGTQTYALAVRDGADGIVDLAGNPVDFTAFVAGTVGTGALRISCANPNDQATKYFALRGGSADEDDDGLPEYEGQYNVGPGVMTGRPVVHFSRTADTGNEFVGQGQQVTPSPEEPLNPMGAVMMNLFRPQDFGFGSPALGSSFFDRNEYNMDVEGMAWSPFGGLNDDFFPRLSLSLSHANQHPDEAQDITGRAIYPASGLLAAIPFVQNVLGYQAGIIETKVFDSSYSVRSLDLFTGESGQTYLPWPDFTDFYTWRDTGFDQLIVGGNNSNGTPPSNMAVPFFYPPGGAPSIAMPLLCRFRCYYIGKIVPINQFNVYHMVTASQLPAFRVFSAGGIDNQGREQPVIPDNESNGGTRPEGGWFNGNTTVPDNDYIYWTQADFVVRVSRVYTHWFDLGGTLPEDGVVSLVVEPTQGNRSPGTDLIFEYRGAFSVTHPSNPVTTPSPLTDAEKTLDVYGDFNGSSGNVSTPTPWTQNLSDLEATPTQQNQFLQIRISFVANAVASIGATLDGLGIAYDLIP
jgi:hypothetical protein